MDGAGSRASAAVGARGVYRAFSGKVVLEDVSLDVAPGEIHALLGPNAAGKTTLLRILGGITIASSGSVRILGLDPATGDRALKRSIGFVPSGDRTFYLRLSGLDNLAFFARLHGLRKKHAFARAHDVLEQVGLAGAAGQPVGRYSHGMQKRLSVARALLADPAVFLIDEATHDLDPGAAENVRDLVSASARRGAAVVWATQRVDEIRGFAHRVTLLDRGAVRFDGTVSDFRALVLPRRYLVRLRNGSADVDVRHTFPTLHGGARLSRAPDTTEEYVLSLAEDVVLGDALASLTAADIQVLGCREERSEGEQAFLALTREPAP